MTLSVTLSSEEGEENASAEENVLEEWEDDEDALEEDDQDALEEWDDVSMEDDEDAMEEEWEEDDEDALMEEDEDNAEGAEGAAFKKCRGE